MRLSEWRKKAPTKESMSGQVLAVLKPVLMDLGAEADAECWVAWGDDPAYRYSILAPTLAGLISVAVRLSGPDEGPRITARLIRWPKVAVTELGIEASGGSRIVAVQVETLVLKGVDGEADRICEFVRTLIASIDDRNPAPIRVAVRQGVAALAAAVPATGAAAEASVAPPARAEASPAKPAAQSDEPAEPKRSGAAAPKALGAPARKTAKAAAKPAATTPGLALAPAAAAVSATVPAEASTAAAEPSTAAAEPPTLHKPLAERAAAAHHGDQPGSGPAHPTPSQAEPEADQPEWVGPHPIEEAPSRDGNRPRPWTP